MAKTTRLQGLMSHETRGVVQKLHFCCLNNSAPTIHTPVSQHTQAAVSGLAQGGKCRWAAAEGCPAAWRLENCPIPPLACQWVREVGQVAHPLHSSSGTICGCSGKPSNWEHHSRLVEAAACRAEGQGQRGCATCLASLTWQHTS